MGAGSIGITLFPCSSCRLFSGLRKCLERPYGFHLSSRKESIPILYTSVQILSKPLLFTATEFVSSYVWMLWYCNSGCTRNSPSSSVVKSPMSKRQLQKCAHYCTVVFKELLHPKYHRWCCKSVGLGVCCQEQLRTWGPYRGGTA